MKNPLNENVKTQIEAMEARIKGAIELKKYAEQLKTTYQEISNINNQLYESIGMINGVTEFTSPIDENEILRIISNNQYSKQDREFYLKEFEKIFEGILIETGDLDGESKLATAVRRV